MNQIAIFIATSPWLWFVIILFPIALAFVFSRMKLKQTSIPEQISIIDGYRVSLYSSHRGLKSAPGISLARNDVYPKLVLFHDHIAFTVLIPARKRMADIEIVDVFPFIGFKSLIISFKGNPVSFIGNIMNIGHLRSVIQFFQEKHVSLSQRAQEFLRTPT